MRNSTELSFRMFFFVSAILFHLMSSTYIDENKQTNTETKSKQKVIIIADPGVDDAAAILMAIAHPDIDVLAVLSNFGVVSSIEAAHNARIILNVVAAATKAGRKDSEKIEGVAYDSEQRHVPVYVGSDFSYGGLPVASAGGAKGRDFHGLQGLGDFSIHTNISEINYITHLLDAQECSQSQLYDCSASSEHLRRATTHQISDHGISQITSTNRDIERSKSGVEYLLNACRSHPGEISILILSPATTLATAVAAFPSLPNYVKRVFIMGGALRVPGNISPVAEFNFGNDAAAASLVVVAFSEKLTILPLDATMLCLLTPADLDMLHSKSGVVGRWFARDLAPFYMKAYRSYNSVDMPLHDAHTVGAFIRPDLYREHTITVEVQIIVSSDDRINGMLLTDTRKLTGNAQNASNKGIDNDTTSASTSSSRAKQSDSSTTGRPSTTQELKSTGIADVVLGVNRDGFVDLFIELLSSIP